MHEPPIDLNTARALDANDPLRDLRKLFDLPPGVTYLDGNSLGALPRATPARVAQVLQSEWGQGLVGSWNSARWIDLPQRVGDKIAPLIGAHQGEVICADSTSVNLFKLLHASILIATSAYSTRASSLKHSKKYIVSERSNFPTDLYIAQSLCTQHGLTLKLVDASELHSALTDEVAVLLLTHVNYRSGAMHDMHALTTRARSVGALAVWDLAHSTGAVPVDLHAAQADMAVGCGYKYLNGGPGAPAFLWVHPQHVNAFAQPLAGWMGHAQPFAFSADYQAASGVARYLCGTPSIISLAALECGVDTLLAARPLGGMATLRKKSVALTELFIQLVQPLCDAYGLQLITPREATQRGSQLSYVVHEGGYAIMQALIARGVVGDFRIGLGTRAARTEDQDILRFGFTPLYTRFEDVWHASTQLQMVLKNNEWRQAKFNHQKVVT
jgi:kynureninase